MAMSGQQPRTLFDKIWDAHVVETLPDGTALRVSERAAPWPCVLNDC